MGQTAITHDAADSAQSGMLMIVGIQESWLETSVTGPGTLSFWWKVSSVALDDFLQFLINNKLVADITGEGGWTQQTYALGTGLQTLRWRFLKTDNFTTGWDRGWVDQVTFTPPSGPPIIESQSGGEHVFDFGTPATLTVSATGSLPLFYQWRFHGTNLVGQTNASLGYASVTMEQAGPYDVVVRNTSGSVTSLVVTLTVRDTRPVIYSQPADETVGVGGIATFSVSAASWLPLTYQWRYRGTNLVGHTNDSLVLIGVTTNQAGPYDVIVASSSGSVTSTVATLTVGLTLRVALEAPQVVWTTGGNDLWAGITTVTHDGTDAAQSGTIAGGEETWMETRVTGPCTLSFWWKVYSFRDYEHLEFWTNGLLAASITGEVDWTNRTFSLGTGPQILRWRFMKQLIPSISSGKWGWVDQVSFKASDGQLLILVDDTEFGIKTNRFRFSVTGTAGQIAVVEGSTNLLRWLPLQTNELGIEPFFFTDPSTSIFPCRFYRARIMP
jgi:hypothetical protein